MIVAQTTDETLKEFNKNVKDFTDNNSDKIVCLISYSLTYLYQPLISGYQAYFNTEVLKIYDTKAIYAHNHELPYFLCAYFILLKNDKQLESRPILEDCQTYINNFAEFNKEILTGMIAKAYDPSKSEVIHEFSTGDMDSLKDIKILDL